MFKKWGSLKKGFRKGLCVLSIPICTEVYFDSLTEFYFRCVNANDLYKKCWLCALNDFLCYIISIAIGIIYSRMESYPNIPVL